MNIEVLSRCTNEDFSNQYKELDAMYDNIYARMQKVDQVMPGINFDKEQTNLHDIIYIFKENIKSTEENPRFVENSFTEARKALIEVNWGLDKRVTSIQLSRIYSYILRGIGIPSDEDLDNLEVTECNTSFTTMAKNAQFLLQNALQGIESALDKFTVQLVAEKAQKELTVIRSSSLKEKTKYDLQNYTKQITKKVGDNPEQLEKINSLLANALAQLNLEKEDILLNPTQVSQIFMKFSKELLELKIIGNIS